MERTSDVARIKQAYANGEKLWVDLVERAPEADALLAETFKIHPLVVEDIWLDRSVPKLEDFGDYLYLVVHGVRPGSGPSRVDLFVFDIVFGPTFVVTQHSKAPSAGQRDIDVVARLLEKGTPWLVHSLLDHLIDQYLPLADGLSREADELEVDVLHKASIPESEGLLQRIHALKRSIQSLGRISAYQRDILGRLADGSLDEIPRDALPYYRDVHDHFARVADQVETYREVVTTTMDAFLSMQSNRMNATMKTLATISTIMLPLSFIASLYGMNFRHMPELSWDWGYPYALSLMVLVGTSLILWFKKKKWL
jgi:magnesium transporter